MMRSNAIFREPADTRALRMFGLMPVPLPRRGLVVAFCVLALGAVLVRPTAGSLAWGDLTMLAGMAGVALVAGTRVDAAAAKARLAMDDGGQWMSIVVEGEAPDTSVAAVRPAPAPSLNDPERRSLTRRHRKSQLVEVG